MDTPEWAKTALPEELHSNPFLKDTADLGAFVNTLTHASQYMGNSLRIPGEDAGEADWNTFNEKIAAKVPGMMKVDVTSEEGIAAMFKQLGQPDDVAGYEAGEEQAWLAEVAAKSNLTKGQFTKLVTNLAATKDERATAATAAQAEALTALETEWGLAAPKNMENIMGLAKLTGAPPEMLAALEAKNVDPNTLRWMSTMAAKFAQTNKFADDKNSQEGNITPLEAEAQIQEIVNNPEYWKPASAIGKQLQAKMLKLQAARAPKGNTALDVLRQGDSLAGIFD